jgi:hypothetical protein
MMQFWPFALGIVASGGATLAAIALFIKLRPDDEGRSPHHQWNRDTDMRLARKNRDRDSQ